MEKKFCQNCNEFAMSEKDLFCIKCGSKLVNKHSEENKKEMEKSSNILKEESNKIPIINNHDVNNDSSISIEKIIGVALAVVFIGVVVFLIILSTNKEKITLSNNVPSNTNNITNPGYLLNPENFLVDEDNVITTLPGDWKSVWVEEVLGPSTIRISYIILQSGKQTLTFAVVRIFALKKSLDECRHMSATKYLKKLLEQRYVYLNGGCGGNNILNQQEKEKYNEKYIVRSVNILNEDLDANSLGSEFVKLISPFAESNNDFTSFNVENIMLRMGYGIPEFFSLCKTFSNSPNPFRTDTEVPRLEKRGFWGSCE